ncbi:MAG TPA: response regulator transcription factor [Acidimicrobiales bacterium]|nr:response regulator transcription factor [Acidimicrobiales bacterium]
MTSDRSLTTLSAQSALLDEPHDLAEELRVLIVDDQALFRRGLQMVLQNVAGIDVVGEAGDGAEALDRARELVPDVVLMELRMPVMNGIEAARRIRCEVPSTRILMLTMSDHEGDLFEAVKAGANGYLLKEVSINEVAEAIRAVGRGHSLISPFMASKLLDEFSALGRRAEGGQELGPPGLTEREVEILRLVARGLSNRYIAAELAISVSAVKNHVRNILEKLHLKERLSERDS